jgi:DNA-binding HxlR family transcriptional regulator
MKPDRPPFGGDSVFRTIDVVGDAWSWLVLREAILHDVRRFNDFRVRLGIARATLQARLERLTAGGLLERRAGPQGSLFSEYALTDSGRDFFVCLVTAMRWGDRWCAEDRIPLPKSRHAGCGRRFEPVLCCSECGEAIAARAVHYTLTPGARAELRASNRRRSERHREPGLELLERERACSIARTLQVVGDRWSGLVIRESFLRTRRFDEFVERLGIAPNILSERLGRLVGVGVLARRPYQHHPLRHEYRLSKKGLDVYPVPLAMLTWGDRWLSGGRKRLVLTHRTCGKRFTAVLSCGNCREPVERGDIVFPVPPKTARASSHQLQSE